MVGLGGLEPPTSPLSGARSSHLSYRPNLAWQQLFLLYRTGQILAILSSRFLRGLPPKLYGWKALACGRLAAPRNHPFVLPLNANIGIPAASRALRTASAMRKAPGVSPWIQIV